jgi:hypothetical protein
MRIGSEGRQDEPVAAPPRWVKVFAIVALVLVAAFVIMLASGHRGPGRHIRSLDAGESSHPSPTGQDEHRP